MNEPAAGCSPPSSIAQWEGEPAPEEMINGVTNALIALLKGIEDPPSRLMTVGHSVRLLLDHAGCTASDVLAEVDRVRPLARFVESEAMGRA